MKLNLAKKNCIILILFKFSSVLTVNMSLIQCFDTIGPWLEMGCWYMSIKQKTTKPLDFPVVLYMLSGRMDIRLIKIQWLFQSVSLLWEYRLTRVILDQGAVKQLFVQR